MNKRDTVERYLACICVELDLAQSANDPYPMPDRVYDRIAAGTDDLISWERETDQFTYDIPTNEQVKQIYPDALKFFNEQLRS